MPTVRWEGTGGMWGLCFLVGSNNYCERDAWGYLPACSGFGNVWIACNCQCNRGFCIPLFCLSWMPVNPRTSVLLYVLSCLSGKGIEGGKGVWNVLKRDWLETEQVPLMQTLRCSCCRVAVTAREQLKALWDSLLLYLYRWVFWFCWESCIQRDDFHTCNYHSLFPPWNRSANVRGHRLNLRLLQGSNEPFGNTSKLIHILHTMLTMYTAGKGMFWKKSCIPYLYLNTVVSPYKTILWVITILSEKQFFFWNGSQFPAALPAFLHQKREDDLKNKLEEEANQTISCPLQIEW